ncbi:MAG: carbohydrate ABC transporter permease [Spirochaetales bacterium]|nr:carbohydrate ABC transporter permease [Spirochaetales bacterium]
MNSSRTLPAAAAAVEPQKPLRSSSRVTRWIINTLVFLFSLSCIFPLIWMLSTSFKSSVEFQKSIIRLPESINFDNYIKIMTHAKFFRYFSNSFIISVITLATVLVLSTVTGYFLSRFSFKGRTFIYVFLMLGLVVPTHAWLLPLFLPFREIGLLDRRITLVFPYVTFALPTAIFLIESFVRSIPEEMEESATMEGCGVWQSLFRIIMPLCKPILSTVLVLTFNASWNEFPFGLVLINRDALKTVPVALTMFTGAYTTDYPSLVSALIISIIPVILFYGLFSRKIMEGMTAGAVKG